MCAELAGPGGMVGITDDGGPRHARRDLLEQLQPFAAKLVLERGEAGDVAARPRQAGDEAGADRVGADARTRSASSRSPAAMAARSTLPVVDDHVRRERDQFGRVSLACRRHCPSAQRYSIARSGPRPAEFAAGPAGTPRDGLRVSDRPRPACRARRCAASLGCCARAASGQRRRAAEQRDELAPLSFDHLVGGREQRRRHGEAEHPGGLRR